jgi:hypothetical protein
LDESDPFDPNTLDLGWSSYVRSTNSAHMALVDYEDWLWLCAWRWRFKPSKGQGMSGRGYLSRGCWIYPNGVKKQTSLFLHVEIMKRIEPPPSMFHTQVDHIDRNRMNCVRTNLRWATPSENNKNKAMPARVGGRWIASRKETT